MLMRSVEGPEWNLRLLVMCTVDWQVLQVDARTVRIMLSTHVMFILFFSSFRKVDLDENARGECHTKSVTFSRGYLDYSPVRLKSVTWGGYCVNRQSWQIRRDVKSDANHSLRMTGTTVLAIDIKNSVTGLQKARRFFGTRRHFSHQAAAPFGLTGSGAQTISKPVTSCCVY